MSGNADTNQEVASAWERIERWISTHFAAWSKSIEAAPLFQPGTSAETIHQLETHLKLELPDQLKTLLMTSNGCREGDYPLPMNATRPTKWRTLSVSEIGKQWDLLSSIAAEHPFTSQVKTVGPVKPVWWVNNWIPLADSGTGDIVCVDMSPATGGTQGQLILYEHDFAERKVLYSSLLDCLRDCAAALESGEYIYLGGVGLKSKNEELPE